MSSLLKKRTSSKSDLVVVESGSKGSKGSTGRINLIKSHIANTKVRQMKNVRRTEVITTFGRLFSFSFSFYTTEIETHG